MTWSDAARAAALEARRRHKSLHAYDSNPQGRWLKEEMRRAAKELHRKGFPLAGAETFSLVAKLPTKLLVQLPGRNNEHKFIKRDDAKVKSMAEFIKKNGSIKGDSGKFYAPFVQINYRGQAFINEGNHRVRAYAAAGRKDIPVQIQYHAGGELRRGPVSLVTVMKYNRKRK